MDTVSDADADLQRFRARVRSFLVEHATGGADATPDDPRGDHALDHALLFQQAVHRAALAGLTVPARYGGRGLPDEYERVWREEAGHFPLMTEELSITLGNCLPTLLQFGTEEQLQRHVPEILAGREVWCQLFSEPEAGSDAAAARTRAMPVPDGWTVSGQKVWTTLAHRADFGVMLARTDPSAPKHAGLSMFILDMKAPGLTTRPIHQIDGGLHFDEVFLDEVFVPREALLGELGAGWGIATAMLHHQRTARAQGQRGGIRHDRTDRLIQAAEAVGPLHDAARDDLVRLYIEEVCQSLLVSRALAASRAGVDPGPIGSLGKLVNARVAQHFGRLALQIVGPASVAWEGDTVSSGAQWSKDALFTLSLSIAGGTNEIQRSILGERVLGLPREPAPAQESLHGIRR